LAAFLVFSSHQEKMKGKEQMNMLTSEKPTNRKARERQNSSRDGEVVSGFDRYHMVAYKLGKRYYANWFPSREDLFQASALAAAEALAQFGEETELKPLCQLIDRVMVEQMRAYGKRHFTNRKVGTQSHLRLEYNFAQIFEGDEVENYPNWRAGAVGVSEFSRWACHYLHQLVNGYEPDKHATRKNELDQRRAELRERLYEVLESDAELKALGAWYLSRSSSQSVSFATIEEEGVCGNSRAWKLIQKARELAGEPVEYNQKEVEQARRVAQLYQASSDKRTRQLGQQLGMSKTSVRKWLEIARKLEILEPPGEEKSYKQQVLELIETNPQLSYTEIGRRIGISKTAARRWKNILRQEKLIA
jgi:DNA-directed RNA polymerase specialized sigma24 family protein